MSSKAYFDEVAENWQAMRTEFFSEAVREKAYLQADLTPGMVVVDVGAGSGFISEGLAGRSLHIVAVDPSERMLETLMARLGGRTDVETRVGDAENLPLADGEADRVFANMMLHHAEHPDRAVREMVRVLKPGGRLIITDLEAHAFTFLLEEHHDRWPGFASDDVQAWFEEAGLVQVSVAGVGED